MLRASGRRTLVRIHSPSPVSLPTAPWLVGEEGFRLLVDAIEDYAVYLLDAEGRVLTWNIGAQKIKGYAAREIIGESFTRFYTPGSIEAGWPQEELRRAELQGRFEDEGWRVRKDGTRFWANVVITALRDEEGQLAGFVKITRDLSERRRHEEALRQSEEKFRLLVDSVRDHAMIMLDPQGRIESWNSGAVAITGYAAGEVLGRHFSLFHTPQDVAAGKPQRELALALSQRRVDDEGWRLRKDGSMFWASAAVMPVFDAGGALRGFAHLMRDVSERRRLVELENSSRRTSEFLAMLSHELRNPLAPMRNAVSIMQIEPLQSPRLRNCRDIIDRQLNQLTRLVDDLLDVGRIVTGKMGLKRERISFRDVALRSAEAARPLMEARQHHLTLDVPDDAVELVGDDARLVQLLQNLLSNAAKYTDSGGDIRLQVRVEDGDVVSVVSDNGCGIAPEALERIFDLFAQEEGAGAAAESGLGIGLTLCRNVAEMHGGIAARRERRHRSWQPLHAAPAHHAIAGGGRRGGGRCGDSAHRGRAYAGRRRQLRLRRDDGRRAAAARQRRASGLRRRAGTGLGAALPSGCRASRPEHAGGQWLRRAAAPARAADAATALCGGDDGLRPRGRPREDAGRRLRCPPDQAGGCGATARDAGACSAGRRIESLSAACP